MTPTTSDAVTIRVALKMICMVAGARGDSVPVYYARVDSREPTLQYCFTNTFERDYLTDDTTTRRKRRERVLVGREWLRQNLPTAWAAIVAARLTGRDARLLPSFVQGGSRWSPIR